MEVEESLEEVEESLEESLEEVEEVEESLEEVEESQPRAPASLRTPCYHIIIAASSS